MATKRLKYFLFSLIIILLFIWYLLPKNYEKKYKVDNYNIVEKFNKTNNEYYFNLSDDNVNFDLHLPSNYLNSKKLISKIETYSNDNELCIVPKISKLNSIPLCQSNSKVVDYRLVSENMKNNLSSYFGTNKVDEKDFKNIKYYNLINKKYLLWNYQYLEYISDKEQKSIKLFNSDYYNIDLATRINNYLVIPNYDQGYSFNEFIIINLDNLKKTVWKTNYSISINSYIVGSYNKSIYLVDQDNKIEYEIVPHVKKIRIVGTENRDGVIYDDGLKKINFNLLLQSKLSFNYNYVTNYILNNDTLIFKSENNEKQVSNLKVNKIFYSNNYECLYLVNDVLYHYDVINGEQKVMQYFEWNFNNNNLFSY